MVGHWWSMKHGLAKSVVRVVAAEDTAAVADTVAAVDTAAVVVAVGAPPVKAAVAAFATTNVKAVGNEPALTMTMRVLTSWGPIVVEHNTYEVQACRLPPTGLSILGQTLAPPVLQDIVADTPAHASAVVRRLERYFRALFAGKPVSWTAIAWPAASPFRLRVWRALCEIPLGRTMGYGELARHVGCPGGARAVGQACGANPIPLFVPCHRVTSATGRLGGFSGGTAWKQWLLQVEGGKS